MKILKLLLLLLTAALCLAHPLHASAAEGPEAPASSDDTEDDLTPGHGTYLGSGGPISSFYVVCTAGSGSITFSARTTAPKVVAKIGQTDICIQRSSDGETGWTDYRTFSDQLSENVTFHYLSSRTITVPNGYYRVVLTHYAKEKGWFFPKTQSVEQTSVVVHVS